LEQDFVFKHSYFV
jgi:hypothetical protein